MVSSCKICGTRTAGHRQYCPHCRRNYKGRVCGGPVDEGLSQMMKFITPFIFNALPFLMMFLGYYLITKGRFEGILLIILGAIIWWPMVSSKRARERYHNRNLGIKDDKELLDNLNNKSDKTGRISFFIIIIVMAIFFLFTIPPSKWDIFNQGDDVIQNNSEIATSDIPKETTSTNQNQEIISSEEGLVNSCISKFSNEGIFDLKETDYQSDFSSASNWIRNNYENSALTLEQKEHNIDSIIENQLPKQEYPTVITYGSKKDGQLTSQGFYYCNKKGLI